MFFSLLRVLFILRFFLSWFAFVRFCLAAFFVSVRCCRCFCARVPAFLRKEVPIYAQRRGRPCARVWRSLLKASGVCAQALASRGAVLAGACRGGCALPRLSARRVAAPCGERRGIAPRRAGLSVRPVPFLREKCGVVTGVFPQC